MTNLENRYRALLRLLPPWYRAEREEEMVGLFLADRTDDLDLEHGWPGWGETGATIALAVRTRFAASGAPARAVAAGDVVRLVALVGALVLGAYAAQGLLLSPIPAGGPVPLADLAALAGSVAVVTGFRGVAKALFTALSVLALVRLVLEWTGPTTPLDLFWQVPLWLTTLALVTGFHRDVPTPALGRWRWALAGAAVVSGAALVHPYSPYPVTTIAVVPAAVVGAGLLRRRSPVAATALGVWIAALLPIELVYADHPGVAAVAAVMVAAATALLVVGLRGLRRPAPPVTP
ncbi:hypothetical protein [Umezawaea sp.]|uniref:hypothetical protein n=1 Tax=Umezawaea sp. TaxID=1955258 RepID=UPI002ED14693